MQVVVRASEAEFDQVALRVPDFEWSTYRAISL